MMTNGIWLMIVGSILIICAAVIYRMKTALDFYRVQEQELDQYAVEVETGDKIEYIVDTKGTVTMRKKVEKHDIDSLIEESVAQYHELLEELVEK